MAAARPLDHSYAASAVVIVLQTALVWSSSNTSSHVPKQRVLANLLFKLLHLSRPVESSTLIGPIDSVHKSHSCLFVP